MARPRWLDRSFPVLGGRVPAPVALLIGATFLVSIAGSLSARNGLAGLLESGALVPDAVVHGQFWRLVTWPLFELDPIGLIFGALGLFWFGSELVRVWGPGRFLLGYFGLAAAAGLVTCLVALGFPPMRTQFFIGMWPVVDALIIAWATCFPGRDVFAFFVLPLRGQNLIYATLAGTLLFALLGGFTHFVPYFAAEFLMLLALRRSPLGPIWARLKYELAYRRWRRRASKLKAVPPTSREEAPRWYH